jgi:hypothetical protein
MTMFYLTAAQQATLDNMPRYRVVAQLHTDAVIVICNQDYHDARVIDVGGRVFSASRYLAILARRV